MNTETLEPKRSIKKLLPPALLSLLLTTTAINAQENDPYTVELYETYCQGCHSVPGANIPIAFNKEHWNTRLKKGQDVLVNSAINGMGNMPAQGLCQECTYEDFEDLIAYMSKPKD